MELKDLLDHKDPQVLKEFKDLQAYRALMD
jgi:hypothetical protein